MKGEQSSKRYTISLASNIQEALEKLAKQKGITKSAIISIAIEKFMKEEESRAK